MWSTFWASIASISIILFFWINRIGNGFTEVRIAHVKCPWFCITDAMTLQLAQRIRSFCMVQRGILKRRYGANYRFDLENGDWMLLLQRMIATNTCNIKIDSRVRRADEFIMVCLSYSVLYRDTLFCLGRLEVESGRRVGKFPWLILDTLLTKLQTKWKMHSFQPDDTTLFAAHNYGAALIPADANGFRMRGNIF